jgi:hypothetical protein
MYNHTLSWPRHLDGGVGGWSAPRPCRFTPGTHRTGGWVGLRPGLDGCGKSRPPPGFDPRVSPARSESLYRLSYPGPIIMLRRTWDYLARFYENRELKFVKFLASHSCATKTRNFWFYYAVRTDKSLPTFGRIIFFWVWRGGFRQS